MIALIPARGGSKGLPGKNIKLLNGKPLISYAIDSALKVKTIDRVIVNTDDPEIAEVAKKYGAEVPFLRPDALASDTANAIDVYLHFIDYIESENYSCESLIILQPTSPLRSAVHIQEAIELFREKQASSVISFTKEQHPVFWHKYINEQGKITPLFEKDHVVNRQELPVTYYPNGAIFIFDIAFLKKKNYYGEETYGYLMSNKNSIDIDTQEDFDYAEFIFSKSNRI